MSAPLDDPHDALDLTVLELALRIRAVPEVAEWLEKNEESFGASVGQTGHAKIRALLPASLWRVAVYAMKGSNEGHYIHVDLMTFVERGPAYTRTALPVLCAKTFSGAQAANDFCLILRRALGDE